MTGRELARIISEKSGVTASDAEKVIKALRHVIVDELNENGTFRIPMIGFFRKVSVKTGHLQLKNSSEKSPEKSHKIYFTMSNFVRKKLK